MKTNEDTELRKNNTRGRRRMRKEQYFIGQGLKNNNKEKIVQFFMQRQKDREHVIGY